MSNNDKSKNMFFISSTLLFNKIDWISKWYIIMCKLYPLLYGCSLSLERIKCSVSLPFNLIPVDVFSGILSNGFCLGSFVLPIASLSFLLGKFWFDFPCSEKWLLILNCGGVGGHDGESHDDKWKNSHSILYFFI